jgi:hypothetical protein
MSWLFEGVEVTELPECVGFVYLITNTKSNKRYIGKKLSHFSKTSIKTVTLKSGIKKKKKVKKQVESDWRTYWSSSIELQNDVKELGEENFIREILFYCQSKGNLSYIELREQILNKVLEDSTLWYNGIIQAKIHRSHVKL